MKNMKTDGDLVDAEPDFGDEEAAYRHEEPECAHDWAFTGTAYGGDDDSYHGEGRSYCTKCGEDGDA